MWKKETEDTHMRFRNFFRNFLNKSDRESQVWNSRHFENWIYFFLRILRWCWSRRRKAFLLQETRTKRKKMDLAEVVEDKKREREETRLLAPSSSSPSAELNFCFRKKISVSIFVVHLTQIITLNSLNHAEASSDYYYSPLTLFFFFRVNKIDCLDILLSIGAH